MKTPEELAEEYAQFGKSDVPNSVFKSQKIAGQKFDFLAGYQAAKDHNADASKMVWISVKDRLPDKDQTVLIYTDGHETYLAKIYEDGEAWPVSNSCGCCGTEEKFTHWMPLPQPPKEEG